jgi:alkylation response protein AidB-like acyl-CoA dehydrogenase
VHRSQVLSITEAFAGSDVAGLRTTAVLDASGENYIVNGTKKWITGGMYLGKG